MNENLQQSMINGWVCGLTDGEGSFMIHIQKYGEKKEGICLSPSFAIGLHNKDIATLEKVKSILNVGTIVPKRSDGHYMYQATSINDCLKIIAFFDKNNVFTVKSKDYELWKECVEMIRDGLHRDYDGLMKILKIREKLNEQTQSTRRVTLNQLSKIIKKNYNKRTYRGIKPKEGKIRFLLKVYDKNNEKLDPAKYEISDKFQNKSILDKCLQVYKIIYPDFKFKVAKGE